MLELRLRNRISQDELDAKIGKVLGPADVSMVATNGDVTVVKPNGERLLTVLRGAIPRDLREPARTIIGSTRFSTTNRGIASGTRRVQTRTAKTSYAAPTPSGVIGAMEAADVRNPLCRLTAWTGQHIPEYQALWPMIQHIAEVFRGHVPERYAAQLRMAQQTHQDWVIPGTPYTTLTVNDTYPTGVHKDAGDLPEGFSCLAVLRRGDYMGGVLTFAEYRVGVDMQDGDVILMDPHEWHGNTDIVKQSDDAQRLSVVLYYRTNMVKCGSAAHEIAKAKMRGAL